MTPTPSQNRCLCRAVPCCALLYLAVPCCAVLCCALLCRVVSLLCSVVRVYALLLFCAAYSLCCALLCVSACFCIFLCFACAALCCRSPVLYCAGLCFGFDVPVLFCCVLCCVTTNTLSVHWYVFTCVYICVLCVYLMSKGGQHKGFPFLARWPPSSGLRGRSMSSTAALSAGCLTRYVRTYYFIRVQQMRTYFHAGYGG